MIQPLGEWLPERLVRRLKEPLPGWEAQRPFSPELAYGRHSGPVTWDVCPAAVLALIYPVAGRWRLPLTLRPTDMAAHGGQICLPGGVIEAGESPEECSVRECEEELGVDSQSVRVIGRLTPLYIYGSNFLVTPCVGIVNERPNFKRNPAEVERLLEADLDVLVEPRCRNRHVIRRRGVCFEAEYLKCGGDCIWGGTGMILGEFIAVLLSLMAK